MTCFGGPIAHLGYFRTEFVERRKWLTERAYADLVALSQFLPGPASSQTGFGIGLMRGGLLGGLAAWTGFTVPSAVLLVLFAFGAGSIAGSHAGAGLLHGLKLVAVAIVAQAVMGMARSLCPDRVRASIATVALIVMLIAPLSIFQVGDDRCRRDRRLAAMRQGQSDTAADSFVMPVSRRFGMCCLAIFFVLLALAFVPVPAGPLALFDAFYRSGALVFGGGHVVLPLLRNAVVLPGWVSDSTFLAGYGAAQAVPGPLFTFAAYLGAVAGISPGGVLGAVIALLAIFVPGILCLLGDLAFLARSAHQAGGASRDERHQCGRRRAAGSSFVQSGLDECGAGTGRFCGRGNRLRPVDRVARSTAVGRRAFGGVWPRSEFPGLKAGRPATCSPACNSSGVSEQQA